MAAFQKKEGLFLTCDAALKQFIMELQEQHQHEIRFIIADLGYCPIPAVNQPVNCNIYQAALPQQGLPAHASGAAAAETDEEYMPGLGQYFIDRKLWPRDPYQEGDSEHPLAHHHLFVTKHVIYEGVQYPTDVWLQAEIDEWQDRNSFEAADNRDGTESDDDNL